MDLIIHAPIIIGLVFICLHPLPDASTQQVGWGCCAQRHERKREAANKCLHDSHTPCVVASSLWQLESKMLSRHCVPTHTQSAKYGRWKLRKKTMEELLTIIYIFFSIIVSRSYASIWQNEPRRFFKNNTIKRIDNYTSLCGKQCF